MSEVRIEFRINQLLDQLLPVIDEIEAIKVSQKKLEPLVELAGQLQREITDLLEKHDLVQRGNFGWEIRTVNFLNKFRREVKAQACAPTT